MLRRGRERNMIDSLEVNNSKEVKIKWENMNAHIIDKHIV